MTRKSQEQRITVTVKNKTVKFLDEVAETFEDFVSRGEIIDMMADYVASLEDDDEVFGESEDEEEEEEE